MEGFHPIIHVNTIDQPVPECQAMTAFIQTLSAEFEKHANAQIASEQKAYLRNQFEFFGIKTIERRQILKPFLQKEFLPPKSELPSLVKELWSRPQREFQYTAQELAFKYSKKIEKADIELYEHMVTRQSWWDTVDFIATKLMGEYFKKFPELRESYTRQWLLSQNTWLQRSALLFQLKYREKTDTALLASTIGALEGSREFFINKAIGWVLREYSRTDPNWVIEFSNRQALSPLSKKEALRLIM